MKKFFNYVLLSAIITSSVAFGMNDSTEKSNQPGKIKSALIYLKDKIVANKKTLAVVAVGGVVVAAAVVGCVMGYRHLERMNSLLKSLESQLGHERITFSNTIKNFITENAKLKDCLDKVKLDMENAKRLAVISEAEKGALSLAKAATEELAQQKTAMVAKIAANYNKFEAVSTNLSTGSVVPAETVSIGKNVGAAINKDSLHEGVKALGSLAGAGLKRGAGLTWAGLKFGLAGLKKATPIALHGVKMLGEGIVGGVGLGCSFVSGLLNSGDAAAYSFGSSWSDPVKLEKEINYSLFASSF